MEPLFLSKEHVFEKISQEAQMPTNEAEWPAAILGELYKQAPYIEGHYMPEVLFKEKSSETGYAVGSIQLSSLPGMTPEEMKGEASDKATRHVQIPFIIRAFKLAPLDLMVLPNGEFRPQNKQRIRDAMFRPQFTDGTARGMRWNTWLDSLDRYPLGSLGQVYLESMNAQVAPYEKMSSLGQKTGTIMADLVPLDKVAYETLTKELNHPYCVAALRENPAFRAAIKKIARLAPSSQEKEAALAEVIPPTILFIRRGPGATYLVKRANPEAYEPVEEELDRGQALQTLGDDVVRAVDASGMEVVTKSPAVREDLVEEKVEPIKDFGLYRVKEKGTGRQMVGWVFPRVVDLDGTAMPMAIFSNGSENSVQSVIAGVRAGSAVGLIDAKPIGLGTFYRTTGNDAVALSPVSVTTVSSEGETKTFECLTTLGEKVRLHATPGVVGLVPVEGSGSDVPEYLIPGDMKFLPLPNEAHVDLIEEPEEFSKTARLRKNSLTITYGGQDQYTLTGCGLDKLADAEHVRIGPEDALFLCSVVGMHPQFAITKLARARRMRTVTIPNLTPITPLREKMAVNMMKVARSGLLEFARKVPKPIWLVKEATILGDSDSVDKVLSLGFINPHNVSIFLSYIPDFETTLAKVCELLFASRIGGDEELEQAAERTMHGLENMISSLRFLGLETTSERESG